MPFLDRHWWVRVLLACGASAVAVVYVVWCVRTGLSIPLDSPFLFGPAALVFAVVIPLLSFPIARYAVVTALPSRRRLRLAAIRGDREAVPASLIVPHPERAADVAVEPLVIAWQPFTFRRSDSTLARVVLVLGLGLLLLVTFFASLGSAMTSSDTFPEIFLHTTLSAILMSLLVIVVLLVIIVISAIFFGFAAPVVAFFGRPFDVMADVEGITVHDLWGRTHSVRWGDARLLEVSLAPPVLGAYRVFTLYGQDSYARWRDDTDTSEHIAIRLDGITHEEGSKRLHSLLDLIAARTGLAPRTFDGTLVVDRRPNLSPLLRRSLRMLTQALACVTLATVSMLFPPVSAGMLTLLPSMAYFVLAAGCLVFIPIYRRRPPAAVGQGGLSDADGAIADQDTQHTYAVYTVITRSQALAACTVSLLICLAALPILFAWFGMLDIPVLHVVRTVQFATLWPAQAAAVLVGFGGVVGLFVLVVTTALFFVKPAWPDVQVDAEGLRDRRGTKDVALAWDTIDSISRSADDEGDIRYTVAGNYARAIIRWSTRNALPQNPALPLPSVTPEQFAAIVVARSGKPLVTR